MATSIEQRLFDIQWRLYRLELKLDIFIGQGSSDDPRLGEMTRKLNTASNQLDAAVEEASKVVPQPEP